MSSEEVKRLIKLREKIEGRIKSLEEELKDLRLIQEFLNSRIIEMSIKKAEEVPTVKVAPREFKESFPLKSKDGKILGTVYVKDDASKIVVDEKFKFDVHAEPFKTFLLDKVLDSMVKEDKELVEKGELPPDKAFSYEIVEDKGILKELRIRNYRTIDRLKRVRSAIRWTLERMLEKIKPAEN